MRLPRIPSIIREAISRRAFIFYYGEPSSGKTCLARLFIDTLYKLGFRYCYIATESGSIAVSGGKRMFAINIEHMAELAFKCIADGGVPVIDTLNAYYTGSMDDARILAFVSALARDASVPVIAAGQVTMDGKPRGALWITPWADYVGLVRRVREGISAVYFEKPRRAIVAFRVSGGVRGRVCWI
jgi:predicted amidohydrolase